MHTGSQAIFPPGGWEMEEADMPAIATYQGMHQYALDSRCNRARDSRCSRMADREYFISERHRAGDDCPINVTAQEWYGTGKTPLTREPRRSRTLKCTRTAEKPHIEVRVNPGRMCTSHDPLKWPLKLVKLRGCTTAIWKSIDHPSIFENNGAIWYSLAPLRMAQMGLPVSQYLTGLFQFATCADFSPQHQAAPP